MKLMNNDKEVAKDMLRDGPQAIDETEKIVYDGLNKSVAEFCDHCEGCPWKDDREITCQEVYKVMKLCSETDTRGSWGAYHFVSMLWSWMIVNDDDVFNTPGLAACFIADTKNPHMTATINSLASTTEDEDTETTVPTKPPSEKCTKSSKKLKKALKQVTDNKNLPWKPEVHAFWDQHYQDLLLRIATVHLVASDDFDDYMEWVFKTPNVPDWSKDASYFAAQWIYKLTQDSGLTGEWGAYHLVSRVSKWMVVNTDRANKWKKACYGSWGADEDKEQPGQTAQSEKPSESASETRQVAAPTKGQGPGAVKGSPKRSSASTQAVMNLGGIMIVLFVLWLAYDL